MAIPPDSSPTPVERSTASAAYSFVRFGGGAIAPWLAGFLGERVGAHVPFYVGAGAVVLAVALLATGRGLLSHVDEPDSDEAMTVAEAVTVGDG